MLQSCGDISEYPNRRQLAQIAEYQFEAVKSSLKSKLDCIKLCSLTIDLWSKSSNTSGLIGVTCHFYDEIDGKRKQLLLSCQSIPVPFTASNVSQNFDKILHEYGIEDSKVFCIVTDNGANIIESYR